MNTPIEESTPPEPMAWYAVKAQTKRESIAVASIRERCTFEVFCPHITIFKMTRVGKRKFTEALFPGYLFVRCNIIQHLRHINSIQGVRGIVRFKDRVSAVPESIIEELKNRLGGEHFHCANDHFEKDDKVFITEGPFSNFVAQVCSSPDGKQRVELLLDFLGQPTKVVLTKDKILPLNPPLHPGQADFKP